MGFFLETVIGGLMSGMLYGLVALGLVHPDKVKKNTSEHALLGLTI